MTFSYSFGEPKPGSAEARQCPPTSSDLHKCEVASHGWRLGIQAVVL